MNLDEPRRRQYLAAMGIENWGAADTARRARGNGRHPRG